MSILVVGLGNPGIEYEETRHNIGFKVLDYWAKELGISFELNKHAWIAQTSKKGKSIWLIKPNTYMNLSGKALSYWMQKEKVHLKEVLVITDDLALPLGNLRLKSAGSDGGHNGLKSIQETLGTNQFPRLRFGIGNDFGKGQQVNYVLGIWKEEEKPVVEKSIRASAEAIELFIHQGIERAMNTVNSKSFYLDK